MKVIIFGATGMVGQSVLRECLRDAGISRILTVGRSATGIGHAKLQEIVHADLWHYADIEEALTGFDACFFCLGVSAGGMEQSAYERITYELTMAAAETLCRLNPQMVFTYITGAGSDSSEQGSRMWARVKGRTENALLRLPFKAAYMFRPGAIRPLHGILPKNKVYRLTYQVLAPVLLALEWAFPAAITNTESFGLAMIEAARHGAAKPFVEKSDILVLSRAARSRAGRTET